MKKTIEYWEVTISCLVRKEDINQNKILKQDVKKSMTLDFDQIEHIDENIKIS